MNNVTRASSLRANTTPIDPDVKIPEAVKRAKAAAEAAQAAAYPDQVAQPTPTPPTNPDTIVIADAPATPPVTPPGNPEPQPAPTPAPPPEPTPAPAPAEESWEHKFRSSEGRRQKLEQLLEQANGRLSSLENMVQELRAAPPAPAPAPAAPERLISKAEEEEFGPEMLDVMARRAKETISPELAEMRASMQALEQKLNGTTTRITQNAKQEMFATLTRDVPDWKQINHLPEFKTWLALPDPYSGATRHSMLLSAFEQNDTPRVLNFFKGFVSELAATIPADEPVATPPAYQPAKPALETLAAPGRARTPAQTNAPAEKQIITTTDINAFYAAKMRGAYNGREAEFAQLEQELFKAQREGRVRAV